jgi:hypothetical protein
MKLSVFIDEHDTARLMMIAGVLNDLSEATEKTRVQYVENISRQLKIIQTTLEEIICNHDTTTK